ncbi:hypothetical protein [Nannocystis pusilla]|uniref:hypothetical protein n=1 Tax=Nannocystis pusilla TaxID=889268 RepID=UPI003B81B4C7
MTAIDEAEAFARTATAVTSAVTQAIAQLEAVLAAQRRGIVALAACGGLELPMLPVSAPALSEDVSKDMSEGASMGAAGEIPQAWPARRSIRSRRTRSGWRCTTRWRLSSS